jgi:hypothetical protein
MMGKRFDKDSEDTHRIWIFPFANLVLRYERMLSARKLAKYRSGTAVRSLCCQAPSPAAPHCFVVARQKYIFSPSA